MRPEAKARLVAGTTWVVKTVRIPSKICAAGLIQAIVRSQTGFRLESRLLKVLKGLAEALDLSLGDLVEGILLHAFENKGPFNPTTLRTIGRLKQVYGLDLTAADSHRLSEAPQAAARGTVRPAGRPTARTRRRL